MKAKNMFAVWSWLGNACMHVFVFEYHEGGWENMRDLLFMQSPSGADLMTRDLKMYMLGKERWWEGGE